jgi:large subunit ribosomal protein L19
VRRAKLYYLRDRVGKRARVRERRYTGPEEAVVPGLLHQVEGATDADGMTAEEAVLEDAAVEANAQDATTSDAVTSPDQSEAPPGEPVDGDVAAEGEGEERGESRTEEIVPEAESQVALDADAPSDAGEDVPEGAVAGDPPA